MHERRPASALDSQRGLADPNRVCLFQNAVATWWGLDRVLNVWMSLVNLKARVIPYGGEPMVMLGDLGGRAGIASATGSMAARCNFQYLR